ncbi:MAG: YceI family protein [Actinomycetota bacterium]
MRLIRNLVIAVVLLGGAALAYIYFSGGSGEPSTELTTPPLPTTLPAETTAATTTAAAEAGGNYVLVPLESTASFTLGENLLGNSNTVVGLTNEVAGQVAFDPDDPAASQISEILINARTFRTDSSNRDRAIRSSVILDSGNDEHELISFLPASIDGLSGPIEIGQQIEFTVTGELTIKGATQSVRFAVTATLETPDQIRGFAEAEVNRNDFGIGIPNAPGVADVSELVTISLEFVAARSQ